MHRIAEAHFVEAVRHTIDEAVESVVPAELQMRMYCAGSDMIIVAMREPTSTYLDAMGPAPAGNWRTEPR